MKKKILQLTFIIFICSCSNNENIKEETTNVLKSKTNNESIDTCIKKIEIALDNLSFFKVKTNKDSIINLYKKIPKNDIYQRNLYVKKIQNYSDSIITEIDKKTNRPVVKEITKTTTIFENINKTRNILSNLGIGKLCEWKSDQMDGYMSITNYFDIDNNPYGMPNLLAIYMESQNYNIVKTIKLVLDINYVRNDNYAYSKFKKTAIKTLNSLSLKIPNGFEKALNNRKEFIFNNGDYTIQLLLEKTRIDTWKLLIINNLI